MIYAFYDMSDEGQPCAWSQPEFSDFLLPYCSTLCDVEQLSEESVEEPLTTLFLGKTSAPRKPLKAFATPEEARIRHQERVQEARAMKRQEKLEEKRRQKEQKKAEEKISREISALKQQVEVLKSQSKLDRRRKKEAGTIHGGKEYNSLRISYRNKFGKFTSKSFRKFVDRHNTIPISDEEIYRIAKELGLNDDTIYENIEKLHADKIWDPVSYS